MVKILLITLLLGFVAASWTEGFYRMSFGLFKQKYGKQYTSDEENYRYQIFTERLMKHQKHNADPTKTWKMGVNKFSDWTWEEFKNTYLQAEQNCSATYGILEAEDLSCPWKFDWRKKGKVSPVKDQGNCGSCWTFSTTGAMESHYAIVNKVDPPLLSEQQLVDCAGAFNNFGCDGGLPSQAFEYIRYAGGITSEDRYPYTAQDGSCKTDIQPIATTSGSFNITAYDENQLKRQLFKKGPISIAFECLDDFMDYEEGVYSSTECGNGPQDVNHAVLAVGYGKENGVPYWLVKNSWGEDWGDEGYFKIARGENMCGLAVCASYPIISKDHADEDEFLIEQA